MRCFGNLAKYSIIHHRESWIRPYIGDNSAIHKAAGLTVPGRSLPKFPKNYMKLEEFRPGGGRPKFYYVGPPLIILRAFPDQIYNSFPVIYFGAGLMLALADLTALFTKPPDGLPPYRTGSGGRSVQQFPIDIFPFCRERPVTKEPVAL